MSRLVLVRRGETVWHGENRYAGTSDVGLTAKGFAQAEQLACWAARAQLIAVWSSPLLRARNTTAPAAQAAQLQLQIDPRLQELSSGKPTALQLPKCTRAFPLSVLLLNEIRLAVSCRAAKICLRLPTAAAPLSAPSSTRKGRMEEPCCRSRYPLSPRTLPSPGPRSFAVPHCLSRGSQWQSHRA